MILVLNTNVSELFLCVVQYIAEFVIYSFMVYMILRELEICNYSKH